MKNFIIVVLVIAGCLFGCAFKQPTQEQMAIEITKSGLRTGTFLFLYNNKEHAEDFLKGVETAIQKIETGQLVSISDVTANLREQAAGHPDEIPISYAISEAEGLARLFITEHSIPLGEEAQVALLMLKEVQKVAAIYTVVPVPLGEIKY